MAVGEDIVFTNFSDEVFKHVILAEEEDLLDLEIFDSNLSGRPDFEMTLFSQQELFVIARWHGFSNVLADCFNALVDF